MKTKRHRKAGLTLVEVMVALFLFTLGMAGLFALLSQLRSVTSLSNAVLEASALASTTAERCRAGNVAALTDGTTNSGPYTVIWSVSTNMTAFGKPLRVRVTWLDTRNVLHDVNVNTYLAY